MGDFSHLKKCIDLAEQDVARAVEERDETRALLAHLAKISSPGTGAAKSLLVFARMATTACDWLDGDLRVEIVGDADVSAIEVLEELGMGMRERVFSPLAFTTPLDEFVRAVERVPHMIAPLTVTSKTSRRIVLGATAAVRKSSLPPPPIKISEESFYVPKAPSPVTGIAREEESPALPVVEPAAPRKKKTSRPPPRNEPSSSARVAIAGKKITITREALPPELPVVTPAKKATPPAPPLAKPPLPRPKPGPPPPPAPKAKPPEEKKDKSLPPEEIDKGWDDD